MNENLTVRIGRIISASINSMVDAVENMAPEMVMEEAIREIDSAIDDVRSELGRVVASKHLANTRLLNENRQHEELTNNIRVALSQSRDDLAEVAIAKQIDIEAQIPVLEKSINEASAQEKELEGFINALQAKKREMKTELTEFVKTKKQAEAVTSSSSPSATDVNGKVESAGNAFDRILEKHSGALGSSTDMNDAAKLAELEELARKNRIQERLAAAKAEQ